MTEGGDNKSVSGRGSESPMPKMKDLGWRRTPGEGSYLKEWGNLWELLARQIGGGGP